MKVHPVLHGSLLVLLALGLTATAQEPKAAAAPSLSQLQAAVRRDPSDAEARIALGLAYWGRNEYPRALQEFRKAVEVAPRSAEAHNWLGVALSEKSDLPGAIAAFKRAIELDPKYGRAFTNLGSALATSGDYTEAVAVFEKALLLEPNNLGAHFNLGLALRAKGDLEAALPHLQGAVEGCGPAVDDDPGARDPGAVRGGEPARKRRRQRPSARHGRPFQGG